MNNEVKVNIEGKIFFVCKGTLLSDIIDIEKPCGGHGRCGKCNAIINGKKELVCKYIVNSDIEVVLPKKSDVFSETGINEVVQSQSKLSIALDIGTTTIALALVSLEEGKIVKVISEEK